MKNITNCSLDKYAVNEFSTIDSFNCNKTAILLIYPNGYFAIHDRSGAFYMMLPNFVNASSRPRWDRKDPNTFTFFRNNRLERFDLAKSWNTNATSLVHEFDFKVDDFGEADLSEDGNHRILYGDGKIWLYQFSTNNAMEIPFNGNIESLMLTPDNNVIISSDKTWFFNVKKYELINLSPFNFHKDVMRNELGQEVMIYHDSNEKNRIMKMNLKRNLGILEDTEILDLTWSTLGGPSSMAAHISCPLQDIFCLVSTYGKDPNVPFANSLVKVFLSGAAPQIIERFEGTFISDNSQPKISICGDGKSYLYRSNRILKDFANVYMGEI